MNTSNNLSETTLNLHAYSDQDLYNLCQQYGSQALEARRKFIGLLPEVNRRKLYEKKGFSSIFQFAAMLAGVSEEQVRRTINVEKKFDDKPILKALLENGEVSVNKLARVAPLVTKENEDFWATQVQNLSNRAVETLVKNVHVHTNPQQPQLIVKEPNLSQEIKQKLVELEEKGIDINEIIGKALQKRECEIAEEKEHLAEKAYAKRNEQLEQGKPVSRYVVVATKKVLKKEYGTKCGITDCHNDAIDIHHTNLFALSGDHNPKYMVPLCKPHHEIASLVNQVVIKKRMMR